MISLATALRLKNAGFPWEPQEGDWVYGNDGKLISIPGIILEIAKETKNINNVKTNLFAPRLDQLLDWLRVNGCSYSLHYRAEHNFKIDVYNPAGTLDIDRNGHFFSEENEADAAAEAVLWVLERSDNS